MRILNSPISSNPTSPFPVFTLLPLHIYPIIPVVLLLHLPRPIPSPSSILSTLFPVHPPIFLSPALCCAPPLSLSHSFVSFLHLAFNPYSTHLSITPLCLYPPITCQALFCPHLPLLGFSTLLQSVWRRILTHTVRCIFSCIDATWPGEFLYFSLKLGCWKYPADQAVSVEMMVWMDNLQQNWPVPKQGGIQVSWKIVIIPFSLWPPPPCLRRCSIKAGQKPEDEHLISWMGMLWLPRLSRASSRKVAGLGGLARHFLKLCANQLAIFFANPFPKKNKLTCLNVNGPKPQNQTCWSALKDW